MSLAAPALRQAERVQLSELVASLARHRPDLTVELVGDPTVEIGRAVHRSDAVCAGTLFCCVPGARHDGHRFAADAVAAGAAALLCEHALDLGVPELRVAAARAAMGPIAALLAGCPSDALTVVGITGTNGKTTTAHLLAAIFDVAGRPSGVIGTLSGPRTTPEAPELQQTLADLLAEGATTVAMEVSSHALDLHRVDGTRFAVAVFTNLSQDHLDHHGDLARYFAAKARLFTPELSNRAVVGTDDPHGRLLLDAATIPTAGFAFADASDVELDAAGSTFTWRGQRIRLGLAGRFNILNALAAAAAAAELGIDTATIAAGLAAAGPVPGRFETVDEGQPFLMAVDYAHTPDGLEQLLVAGRELAGTGRVIVVFGAGGDRDHDKRPLMGEAAARLADVVVLTTDNPRSEDPAEISHQVRLGMATVEHVQVEPDRAAAIAMAVASARAGDVVLVAGKGHETSQIVGDRVLDFDDRVEARRALAALGATS
jgi:UDP-N-acetylmuramoyl-L-alanyl-D-glutamate--2,6-diaminopimelate ligase